MPAPTFTPGDNKQDERLDPSQQDYERRFNDTPNQDEVEQGLRDLENYANNPENHKEDSIHNQEAEGSAPRGSWNSSFTGNSTKTTSKAKAWFKKSGPLLGIGGSVGVLGIIVAMLTTPSILIVQIKETMTDKFNTQLSSMETRSNKLLFSKITGATKGLCTSKVSIGCKFTSMNDKQVASLKEAGFTLKDEKTTFGRTTVSAFEFEGKEINAGNFNTIMNSDPTLRSRFKAAYNPKYAGTVGKAWAAVAAKYKISKQAPDLDGEDSTKAKEKLQSIAKEGMTDDSGTGSSIKEGDKKDPNCTKNCATWTAEEVQQANGAVSSLAEEGKSGAAATKVNDAITKMNVSGIGSLVKITGIADSTCTAIGAFNTLTYAAKAIRVLQLVRYMMVFSSIADSIKAGGNPKPADVAFLGTIATTMIKSPSNDTLVGSLTDSFGYKYAANGDSSAPTRSMNIANRFMAGGGMVGDLNNFANTIYGFFGDRATARQTARTTCGVLANPVVQAGSILVGVAALLVPGVNVGLELAKAGATAAVSIGISMIPSLLADIVAGTVTDGIVGEEAGDAIASGYGSLMSDSLAGQNGAAPMSKADAVAYNSMQTDVNNQYIADDLQNTSPFDPTNPHTFMGSIVASLLPLKSASNPLTSVGSFLSNSFQSLIPTTKAASNEQYADSLDVCQDPDAQDGGYAVDPFCNVVRGIPPQYVNRDPVEVAQRLIDTNQIQEDGTVVPGSTYEQTIKKCMTSSDPIGYSEGTDFNPDEAKSCVINDSNADFYVNYMDQRIDLGMSGEDVADGSSTSDTPSASRPDNAVNYKKGWSLANNTDYSQTPCDPRTQDAGTYTNPTYGFTIRLCTITFNTPANSGSGSNQVASVISANTMNMFEAAKAAGVELGLSDGFRQNAASYSQHKYGIAMDLGTPRGGQTICFSGVPSVVTGWGSLAAAQAACQRIGGIQYQAYQWLNANAANFGFYNLESEPWHWSSSGG